MATEFTPIASTIGGILIGLSAVILMLFLGRIAGATGILAGALWPTSLHDWLWRIAFLLGMVAAPSAALIAGIPIQPIEVPIGLEQLAIGGIIVGCGVTLGAGCTSGHGVCGLSRFSIRSLVATLTFMVTTAITVFLIRHVMGG